MEMVTIGIFVFVAAFVVVWSARKMTRGTRKYTYRKDENGNDIVVDLNED